MIRIDKDLTEGITVPGYRQDGPIESNTDWNRHLHEEAKTFSATFPDTTVLLFSSWAVFERIDKEPGRYGFPKTATRKMGDVIWWDHIHPTSAVHRIICDEFKKFLEEFPAFEHTENEVDSTNNDENTISVTSR